MWRGGAAFVVAVVLTACAGSSDGSGTPSSSTRRSTTTSTSTLPTTTTSIPPPDAIEVSTAPTTCPAQLAQRSPESIGAQRETVTRALVTYEYPITGVTTWDLAASLDACRPTVDNESYDGYTQWFVSWYFSTRPSGDDCYIELPKVRVRVDIYLPRWMNPSSSAMSSWNRYIAALKVHEDGHKQNGIDAGDRIYAALSALPPSPTCAEARAAAEQAASAVISVFNQQDIAYDADTGHGATQGAVFP